MDRYKANKFLHSEEGQAVTEYIFIVAAAATFAIALSKALVSALDSGILSFGIELEKNLKTGRIKPGVWTNG